MLCSGSGIYTTYIVMIYIRYICKTLIDVQNLLIKKTNNEIICGTFVKTKIIEMLNIWDMFNDLVYLYGRTFGVFLHLAMFYNCEVIATSLYGIVKSFQLDTYHWMIIFFRLHFVATPMLIIVCLVNCIEHLTIQVIFNLQD